MFNFFNKQISAEEAAKKIVYGLSLMVSDGHLSLEKLNSCGTVGEIAKNLGSDFVDNFIERIFASEEFLHHHKPLNAQQRIVIARTMLVASKNMQAFVERMVAIYAGQKTISSSGGKAIHYSWRFPEFSQYESEFKLVKDVLAEAFPRERG